MLVEIRSFPGTVIFQTCCANSSTREGLCGAPSAAGGTRSPAEPQLTLWGQKHSSLVHTCSIQYSQCYLFSKEVSKILFHLIVELCVYPLPHLKPVLVKVTNMMQYSRKWCDQVLVEEPGANTGGKTHLFYLIFDPCKIPRIVKGEDL